MEQATFGLIYGAVMVLGILMALELQPNRSYRPAFVLFGSVLAMALARSFALLFAHGIATGERIMSLGAMRSAWSGSYAILVAAYLPTALFVAVGFGWLKSDLALYISQIHCVLILAMFGARAGYVIRGGLWYALLGAVFAGGFGTLLAAMKYALN